MSDQEIEKKIRGEELIQRISQSKSKIDENKEIGGSLGKEGKIFLIQNYSEKIEEDLKQALHIKNFIKNSVEQISKLYKDKNNELLLFQGINFNF